MYSKLKKLSPLTLLFFIPLIPHFNVVEGFIHTDDLPILFFGIFILFNIKKLDLGFKQPVRIVILFIFIIYLLIQNQLVGNTFFNSEILRYFFYGILFIFVISTDINTFHEDIPFSFCPNPRVWVAAFPISKIQGSYVWKGGSPRI